ncbi:sialate O-acetylesterase [Flammeovirga aprica]|uniref:Sialate O-acetylesterase n=1 Tax=Flammeovirga aprica JL-4 TaxID=694437 RepID=A0A7X9RUN1_9BACT|nr:sialate O-acetylesterase [Flammeovirga aprica]NME69048.1 sialate O-acetylesterase [Flammeovirga aprica JL-4]
MRQTIITLCCIIYSITLHAQTKVSTAFSDHMVLQQQTNVSLWGWDNADQKVSIKTTWGEKLKTVTNNEGKWEVKIPTPNGNFKPHEIIVKGSSSVHLKDILIGEVWLASGQSNMQMPLWGYVNQPVLYAKEAISMANRSSGIRILQVERKPSDTEVDEVDGKWEVCTAQSIGKFSAVAYFFGNQLYRQLNVPIGLIHASRGGTKAECWIKKEEVKTLSNYKEPSKKAGPNRTPSVFYNNMIHPLVGYTIKGVIWYQGEANRKEYAYYPEVMEKLIGSWKEEWNQGDFSFYMVEIAPFAYGNPKDDTAAKLRESQLKIANKMHNVGLVSTADLGDVSYIHPSKKKKIGERLSYLALTNDYKVGGFNFRSPQFDKTEIFKNSIKVYFKDTANGITSFSKKIRGFEIAGEDKKYYPAEAKIVKGQKAVMLQSSEVSQPKYVRYGFKNYHQANLKSVAGLPVFPFRTDTLEKQEQ